MTKRDWIKAITTSVIGGTLAVAINVIWMQPAPQVVYQTDVVYQEWRKREIVRRDCNDSTEYWTEANLVSIDSTVTITRDSVVASDSTLRTFYHRDEVIRVTCKTDTVEVEHE